MTREEEFRKSADELKTTGHLTCYVCGYQGTFEMRSCTMCGKQICYKHQKCLDIRTKFSAYEHWNFLCPKCWKKATEILKKLNISF